MNLTLAGEASPMRTGKFVSDVLRASQHCRWMSQQVCDARDIFAAVALVRPTIIAPPMCDIEKRYADMLMKIELESSLLCDFELRQRRDQRLLEKRAQSKASQTEQNVLDEEIGIMASTDEEKWQKEAKKLRKHYAIGDSKKFVEHDLKSWKRKIDEPLVLVVRQIIDDDFATSWILPQIKHIDGETLKQTSERCLKEIISGHLKARIMSNAPISVYSYNYPMCVRNKSGLQGEESIKGSLIFIYKALWEEYTGFSVNKDIVKDHKWISQSEMLSSIKPARYLSSLSTLFPPDILSRQNKMSVKKVSNES